MKALVCNSKMIGMPITTSCHLISDVFLPLTSRKFGESHYCFNHTIGNVSIKRCGTKTILEQAVRIYGLTGTGCQKYGNETVCLCNTNKCN